LVTKIRKSHTKKKEKGKGLRGFRAGFITFSFFRCDLVSVLRFPSLFELFLRCFASKGEKKTMWYLCVFFHRLLDYRKPEVESLAQLFGAIEDPRNDDLPFQLQWKLPPNYHTDSPFHFVNLPSEQLAHDIAARSQLLPLNDF